MSPEDSIFIGLGIALIIIASIVIGVSVYMGKSRNWGGGKIFGMILLGMFFFPIWIIIIIVLAVMGNGVNKTTNRTSGNTYNNPLFETDQVLTSPRNSSPVAMQGMYRSPPEKYVPPPPVRPPRISGESRYYMNPLFRGEDRENIH